MNIPRETCLCAINFFLAAKHYFLGNVQISEKKFMQIITFKPFLKLFKFLNCMLAFDSNALSDCSGLN